MMVTSKLNIGCLEIACLMEKSDFWLKHEAGPNFSASRNFMFLGTEIAL